LPVKRFSEEEDTFATSFPPGFGRTAIHSLSIECAFDSLQSTQRTNPYQNRGTLPRPIRAIWAQHDRHRGSHRLASHRIASHRVVSWRVVPDAPHNTGISWARPTHF
jgi:hypothetical protein